MSDDGAVSKTRFFVWAPLLLGQGLFVFAVVALSGPGRIDIVDGQTRFEVGRSLVEHGDSALRDPRIWWGSFPGRDGLNFSYYRFPQSLLAAVAIFVADTTGPVQEGRRHFFFVLTSALAASILSLFYTLGFHALGCRPRTSVLWALGGIFCTPSWFYATSTFDDILGTTCVVAAVVTAMMTRQRRALLGAVLAGLWMGLAFNCKEPLGAFIFAVLAIHDDSTAPRRQRVIRAGVILTGLLLGIVTYLIYDYYKFPFDKQIVHARELQRYAPVYAFHPLTALACFAISPGCGIFWYCPPLILGLAGVVHVYRRGERKIVAGIVVTSVIFIGFHCFISFFKGDIAWGPRYLTPWFGLIWLFAAVGARIMTRRLVISLLSLGVVVQLLGLAADPHRLYVERGLPSAFGVSHPFLYFHPAASHLVQRPREIIEMLKDSEQAPLYSPAHSPTFAMPLFEPPDMFETGRPVVERYAVLRSFRPWWWSQRMLPEQERPVPLANTVWVLLGVAAAGSIGMSLGIKMTNAEPAIAEFSNDR